MSWDQANEALAEASKGTFVKLKDGEKISGVFVGEPLPYTKAPFKPGEEASQRFLINFAAKDANGAFDMRVWDMSTAAFKLVARAHEKYKGLAGRAFEISREGDGLKTKYAVMYEDKISADESKLIASLEPHDLQKIADGGDEFGADVPDDRMRD